MAVVKPGEVVIRWKGIETVGGGTATNVQGTLVELAARIAALETPE